MSGVLQLLRALLLGACTCIVAAQLGHAETRGAELTQSGLQAFHAGASLALQTRVPTQWRAYAQSGPQAPSDSQMPGDTGAIDADADDVNDFEDASLHGHLSLFCLDFGVSASVRGGERERVHARREDRRCDKPPRARVA